MNNRPLVIERAKLRLADAEQAFREEQQRINLGELISINAQMIANTIYDNDVYFFIDPLTNDLVISSLKTVETIH